MYAFSGIIVRQMNKKIVRRRLSEASPILAVDLHPLLARIYSTRQVSSSVELENSLDKLLPVDLLSGIEQAVDLLIHALKTDERILIVGDFDADGATSCALAVRALRMLGVADVDYLVPNRFEFGYGLTKEIVAVAAQGKPDLIITVDNGISSVEGVKAARENDIKVLVTDHHLPGKELPNANAIVNPNQEGDTFPSKNLAGVGVIFYVMLALRTRLRALDWFDELGIEEPNLAQLLDLVALGTVADVVTLDQNNRILVEQGLRRIRAGQCCVGIKALLEVAGRRPERVVASDFGFAVAPRLNAAGRLNDMSQGIACLLSNDPARARERAKSLDSLNKERRDIEQGMKTQAISILEALHLDERLNKLPMGLCLFDEGWHQGVIGILASRIKEHMFRPVIIFAPSDEKELKGSARSIPGLHIRDVLDAVAAHNPGLLTRFGGHAMAAGMTLKREHYTKFSKVFDDEVRRQLSADDLQQVVHSDGQLTADDHNLEIAEMLRSAGPWGQGFPEPVFDGRFDVIDQKIVGDNHLKMVLKIPDSNRHIDAIAFNTKVENELSQVDVAYRLDVNEFRGRRAAQLIIEHIEGC